MLISNAGRSMSIKLQLSMETGLRPVELMRLKVKDIDLTQRLVYPTTAKHGSNRTLKISQQLANKIQSHIIQEKLNQDNQLFKGNATRYGKHFRESRNYLAQKLGDPTLRNIRLYDFRHYFATTLYHKTKDLLYVKQQMGHKRIDTTLIYTQLLNLNEDEWIVKVAKNLEEATKLLETGFDYVTEMDGIKLFRIRK